MKPVEYIQTFFEKQAFGVCRWWGEKLGIETSQVRLYFIYLSFLTFGSPIIIYLFMAFILRNKHWFQNKRSTIWDL